MAAAGLHQRKTVYQHSEIEPVEDEDTVAAANSSAALHKEKGVGYSLKWAWRGVPKRLIATFLAAILLGVFGMTYLTVPRRKTGAGAQKVTKGQLLLTPEQLAQYDGTAGRQLYLAVMGQVFDVTAGARHYGSDGGYSAFAGRDASRAYVTGKFQEDLNDDVADFRGEQFQELVRWHDFYLRHKEYRLVGKVVGRFYDAQGAPTPLLLRAQREAAADNRAEVAGQQAAAGQAQGSGTGVGGEVPCNVKWSRAEGGWVWCPDSTYPRRIMRPDWQGQLQQRCVCLEGTEAGAAAQVYAGCSPEATMCQTSAPEQG